MASGGLQYVLAGATAASNDDLDRGVPDRLGFSQRHDDRLAAFQYIYNGATATITTVASGAVQLILAGAARRPARDLERRLPELLGTANATTLSAGAIQYVFSGASASGTTMSSGAILQEVLRGGVASNTSVGVGCLPGGPRLGERHDAGDQRERVCVQRRHGDQHDGDGSVALQYIVAGGSATSNTINGGGLQYVYGIASGTTLSGSGTLGYVFNGGVADNLSIVGSGATEQVNVGGVLSGGSVLSGALEYILGSGSNIW